MIDKDGNVIIEGEIKLDTAAEKIKAGLKKLHPEEEVKKEYLPHQPEGAKTKISEGLEEWMPSGKDGKPLQRPLTVDEKRAAKFFGLNPDDVEAARGKDD